MVVEKNLGSNSDDLIDIVIIIKSVKTELIWTIHVVNTDSHMCIHIATKKKVCIFDLALKAMTKPLLANAQCTSDFKMHTKMTKNKLKCSF